MAKCQIYGKKTNLYHEIIQILSQLIGLNSTGQQEDAKLKSILVNLTELRDSNLQPAQTSINYWSKAYATGSYSKQDLDKIILDDNSIISSCQAILTNLQSGNINNSKNVLLWKSIMNLTDEVDTITNKLNVK